MTSLQRNIKKWLEEAMEKTGEQIEAIVVGKHDSRKYDDDPDLGDENVVLDAATGLSKLDVDYDPGYGGADCFPMYAWTSSRVYFIAEYDGSTGLSSVPRNPINCTPQFDGNDSGDD